MKPIDILFTPIDGPLVPEVNLPLLRQWIDETFTIQNYEKRKDGLKRTDPEIYPWKSTYSKIQKKWVNNFDILFPELSNYFSAAYNLDPELILDVLLLPLKDDKTGTVFWHADPDLNGLRFYIENKQTEDFLYMVKSNQPVNNQSELGLPLKPNMKDFKRKLFVPKLPNLRQPFYLNNIRALHAVNNKTANSGRISVIVTVDKTMDKIPELENLIINSAEKYNEYAIMYNDE